MTNLGSRVARMKTRRWHLGGAYKKRSIARPGIAPGDWPLGLKLRARPLI